MEWRTIVSIEGKEKEKEKRLDGESLECGFVGSDGVAPTGLGDGRPGAFSWRSSLESVGLTATYALTAKAAGGNTIVSSGHIKKSPHCGAMGRRPGNTRCDRTWLMACS